MQFMKLASPFAIFEGGSAYVLPNVLPETARNILSRLDEEPVDSLMMSLRGLGQEVLSPDTSAKDAEKVWNFFVHYYLMPTDPELPSTTVRIEMLRIMVGAPPGEAWKALRTRILTDIDDLSGWTRSVRKELAEKYQVWLGEDGNYYGKQSNGVVYQAIGAQTLEEARLDFLTEQITREFGVVRMFLQFFSWLVIAQDFVEHGNSYHSSMKAFVQDRQWPSLNHRWSVLQWHVRRTVIWRPWSNLCDPQWLAGDLLAAITDTLATEPYRPARIPVGTDSQLGPEYERQMDFALDTQLRIGDEEAIALQFEGREYRWINASLESDTRVSVGLREDEDRFPAEEQLNRFLSILAWEHGVAISKQNGPIIGRKRELPWIVSPRSIFSLKIDPRFPIRLNLNLIGQKENLVLAIFREAKNARSVFYSFLNYWKIIEVIFRPKGQRFDWVDQSAASLTQERERVAAILQKNPRISEYLDNNCRNAVVHVFRPPFVNPDSGDDFVRLSLDLPIVRSLAKVAMRTLPAFS
jgi:hypothetical protein